MWREGEACNTSMGKNNGNESLQICWKRWPKGLMLKVLMCLQLCFLLTEVCGNVLQTQSYLGKQCPNYLLVPQWKEPHNLWKLTAWPYTPSWNTLLYVPHLEPLPNPEAKSTVMWSQALDFGYHRQHQWVLLCSQLWAPLVEPLRVPQMSRERRRGIKLYFPRDKIILDTSF